MSEMMIACVVELVIIIDLIGYCNMHTKDVSMHLWCYQNLTTIWMIIALPFEWHLQFITSDSLLYDWYLLILNTLTFQLVNFKASPGKYKKFDYNKRFICTLWQPAFLITGGISAVCFTFLTKVSNWLLIIIFKCSSLID